MWKDQSLCCHIYFEKCLSRPVFWKGWGCFEWRCVLITPILDKVSKTDTQLQSQDVMVPKSAPRQFLASFVKAKVVVPLHWIRTVLTLLVTFSSKFPQFPPPVLWNVNGSRIFLNSRSFQFNYNYSLVLFTGSGHHWLSVWTALLTKWHNRNIQFVIGFEIWNFFNLSIHKNQKCEKKVILNNGFSEWRTPAGAVGIFAVYTVNILSPRFFALYCAKEQNHFQMLLQIII